MIVEQWNQGRYSLIVTDNGVIFSDCHWNDGGTCEFSFSRFLSDSAYLADLFGNDYLAAKQLVACLNENSLAAN